MKKFILAFLLGALTVVTLNATAATTFTVTTTTESSNEIHIIKPIVMLSFAGSVDVIVEELSCNFSVKNFRDIWENIKGNKVEGDYRLKSNYKHVAQNIYINGLGDRFQIDDVRNKFTVKNAQVEANCAAKQADQTFWEQNR